MGLLVLVIEIIAQVDAQVTQVAEVIPLVIVLLLAKGIIKIRFTGSLFHWRGLVRLARADGAQADGVRGLLPPHRGGTAS